MTKNQYLYNLRIKNNLSLSKAAKKLHFNYFILKNLEEGYLRFTKKRIKKICDGYNIKEDEFDNCSDLVYQVDEESTEESKFLNKLKDFLFSIYFYVFTGMIMIFSMLLTIIGKMQNDTYINTPLDIYSSDYVELYNYIQDNGEEGMLGLEYVLYSIEGQYVEFPKEDYINSMEFYISRNQKFPFIFYINNYISNDSYTININISAGLTTSYYIVYSTISTDNYKYSIYGTYDTKNFLIDSISSSEKSYDTSLDDDIDTNDEDSNLNSIINKTDSSTNGAVSNEEISKFINDVFDLTMVDAEKNYNSIIKNGNFKKLLENHMYDNINYTNFGSKWYLLLVIFSIVFVTSLIGFLVLTGIKIFNYRKKKVIASNNNLSPPQNSTLIREINKKNMIFSPFIKDGYLRIIGIILLFIGSSANAMYFFYVIYLGSIVEPFLTLGENAHTIKLIAPVAYLLIIFLKLYGMQKNKSILINVITMFYIGLIFYIFELCTAYYFTADGNMATYLLKILPTNLFWSLELFFLTSACLFHTPKFINTKIKTIIYRLCSLIPVIYIAICYALLFQQKSGYLIIPDYIKYLLINKNIVVALFGVLFIYGCYILKVILKKKYGDNYLLVERTNQIEFIKNIIAVVIIILLAILDNTLCENEIAVTLGFGKNKYIYFLIPFILFYKERLPKANPIQNVAFNFLAGVGNIITYILLICWLFIAS